MDLEIFTESKPSEVTVSFLFLLIIVKKKQLQETIHSTLLRGYFYLLYLL